MRAEPTRLKFLDTSVAPACRVSYRGKKWHIYTGFATGDSDHRLYTSPRAPSLLFVVLPLQFLPSILLQTRCVYRIKTSAQ